MALGAQNVHRMWTRTTTDLESPELTIFYRVLSAAFTPDVFEGTPPPPKSQLLVPPPIPGLTRSYDMVDWKGKRRQARVDEGDSSDEDNVRRTRRRVKGKQTARNGEISPDVLWTQLYVPFGEWAWAAHHSMSNVKTQLNLGVSGMCSATLRTCTIENRSISVLSHSWSMINRTQFEGFYRELALLKSSDYLRPLQGTIVPALINVTRTTLNASLNMALPHPIFWIEASADMPFVLKERVIKAYGDLHARGILHGSPQLRNMLIGGDGEVKLVDFQSSRSLHPLSIAGIHRATAADFDLEFRQVCFKLDYVGARHYEASKRERAHELEARNRERARLRKLMYSGKWDGQIDDDEVYTGDDATNPPIPDPFWQDHWTDDIDRAPRRFIVPGHTEDDLRKALQHFEDTLVEAQAEVDEQWRVQVRAAGPSGSRSPPGDDELETVVVGRTYVRRRKRSPTECGEVGGPSRSRPDTQEEMDRVLREAHDEATAATEYPFPSVVVGRNYNGRAIGVDKYNYDLLPATSAAPSKGPIVRDYGVVVAASGPLPSNPYPKSTSSKTAGVMIAELPSASSNARRPPKAVKVVDFASRPHRGSRGYYVYHPPTEHRMEIERLRYVREMNRETAENMGFGPLYPTDDKYCIPPAFKRPPSDRPWYTSISLGTLKRRREVNIGREESEEYPCVPKRQKTEGEKSGDEPGELDFLMSVEHVDLRADCELLLSSEVDRRIVKGKAKKRRPGQSILKVPRPRQFRKLPVQRSFWTGEREPCLSPKLGPPQLPVGPYESRAILGSFVYPALPYWHLRQLTSEHKALIARHEKLKASTPPPSEALVAAGTPAPEAGASAPAAGAGAEPIDDDPLLPADDSAPYWPVEEEPAAPVAPVQAAAPTNRAHSAVHRAHDVDRAVQQEATRDYLNRATNLLAMGCRPPPRPTVARRRRYEEIDNSPQSSSLAVQPAAAPPHPSSSSRPSAPMSHPSSSSSNRHTPHRSSRPSSSRRRQPTPGPTHAVATSPATRPVPVYGHGATFTAPRLPGSTPDHHRAKRRRTNDGGSTSLHSSPTPPARPVVLKEEPDDEMLVDPLKRQRGGTTSARKGYWQSFVGWFTGSG